MSFLCANSGDYRNPALDELFDKAMASVRRMCEAYAAQQTAGLRQEIEEWRENQNLLRKENHEQAAELEKLRPEWLAAIKANAELGTMSVDTLVKIDELVAKWRDEAKNDSDPGWELAKRSCADELEKVMNP